MALISRDDTLVVSMAHLPRWIAEKRFIGTRSRHTAVPIGMLEAPRLPQPRRKEAADLVAVEDAPRAIALLLGHGQAVGIWSCITHRRTMPYMCRPGSLAIMCWEPAASAASMESLSAPLPWSHV